MTFTIIGLWRTFRRSQNLSNAASSRASCPISDVRRYSGDYVVSRKRPPNPLQLELADTFTVFSTFVRTRGLMRICPGLASSQSRTGARRNCRRAGNGVASLASCQSGVPNVLLIIFSGSPMPSAGASLDLKFLVYSIADRRLCAHAHSGNSSMNGRQP